MQTVATDNIFVYDGSYSISNMGVIDVVTASCHCSLGSNVLQWELFSSATSYFLLILIAVSTVR